ncbi:potassium channel family protein [Halocatena pleomorpha]|uniref:TrkA family potassium uptake protein n=1 Tax=Halocatena pleomorpha TaxID=1785090 RepID=A0A3P3RCZ8_9EURY|nr:NAD-binding protein [Halocatena pleomorpha]RRJ31275.1 TrkA family potassium uptake protein [Halocatena pleomorpha]
MDRWRRRLTYYLLSLVGIMLGYAVVYHFGMVVYEGATDRSFLRSLQFVVETFTTTGYGSDAGWQSPQLLVLVMLMDITGVALIFIALPVLVVPLFEAAFSVTVPTAVEADLSDHVIICGYTPRVETLIAELESWEVEYVIIEPDRDQAADLYETGHTVIHADPESVSGFEHARIATATAVVTDTADERDVSIVLTAKEAAENVRVISVVDEPERSTYHRLAGADTVLSPRELLGEGLATKLTTAVTTDLGDAADLGEDFEIVELPIHRETDLVGQTLIESSIREQMGVNVIGVWFHGDFETPPSPDTELKQGMILLIAGRSSRVEALKERAVSDVRRFDRGETVVIGYGEVGNSVVDSLGDAGVPCTIIDRADLLAVDVVGEATDPDVLREAGIESAQTAVLALPDDTVAQFVTLAIRDLNPTIEIIARAEGAETTAKMYRAGADYVLSLATVSGRMLASTILENEEVVSLDAQIQVLRTHAPRLAGHTVGDAEVRTRTGCTILGVERNGDVITDIQPDFRIRAGDSLIIAGTDEDTNRFTELLSVE